MEFQDNEVYFDETTDKDCYVDVIGLCYDDLRVHKYVGLRFGLWTDDTPFCCEPDDEANLNFELFEEEEPTAAAEFVKNLAEFIKAMDDYQGHIEEIKTAQDEDGSLSSVYILAVADTGNHFWFSAGFNDDYELESKFHITD